jgi:hypothetical protein
LLGTQLQRLDADGQPTGKPVDVSSTGQPPLRSRVIKRPRTIRIGVVVPLASLLDASDAPGELADRSGFIPGDILKEQIADTLDPDSRDEILFTRLLTDIQAMWCPEVPGLSGRRCEDRWVRHPPIVVASPIGARRDSLPVDHVGVRGLLPETGHPVRNLATAPNSPRIPVSECLVRLVLMRQWAVDGS